MSEIKFILLFNVRMPCLKLMQSIKELEFKNERWNYSVLNTRF